MELVVPCPLSENLCPSHASLILTGCIIGLCVSLQAQPAPKIEGISDKALYKAALTLLDSPGDTTALLNKAFTRGYYEFTLDSIGGGADTFSYYFHQGPYYELYQLEIEGLAPSQAFVKYVRRRPPYYPARFEELLLQELEPFHNQGRPFASFKLSPVKYEKRAEDTVGVILRYRFEPGPEVYIDSLIFSPALKENPSFLYNLMGVRSGLVYNHKAIMDIDRQLNGSIYYEGTRETGITFPTSTHAWLTIQSKNSKVNTVDAVLGILPARSQEQKLQVVGIAELMLVSPFKQGEIISFSFNKFTGASQSLKTELQYPYPLGIPFVLEGYLKQLKQENYFLNLDAGGAIAYIPSPGLRFTMGVDWRATRIIEKAPDTLQQAPGKRNLFKTTLSYDKTDEPLNPRKGYRASIALGIGKRVLEESAQFPLSVLQEQNRELFPKELSWQLELYQRLGNKSLLYLRNKVYTLEQKAYLLNEQIPLGGIRTLRGFNENEFFSDRYMVQTGEYRFTLENDTYLLAFLDYAYLRDKVTDRRFQAMGLGLGLNYASEAGILSIVYAVGKSDTQTFQPARGKIHIGFINRF